LGSVERPQGGKKTREKVRVLTERTRERIASTCTDRPAGRFHVSKRPVKETRKAGGGPKPTSASPLTFGSFLIKDVDRQRQQLRGIDEQLAGNENLIEEPI